jgi:hypothetical protein
MLGVVATVAAATEGIRRAQRFWERACPSRSAPAPEPAPPPAPAEAVAPADPPTLGERWLGVAAAAQADELVIWSQTTIWSVTQRRPLLEGSGDLEAVAVAPDGTVYAIRTGTGLGVAKGTHKDQWRRLPRAATTLGHQGGSIDDGPMLTDLVGLQTDGEWLAWILGDGRDNPRLALSRDGGRSWQVQALPQKEGLDLEAAAIRVHADGGLDLLAAYYVHVECGAREAAYFRGRIGSSRWRLRPAPGGDDGAGYLLEHTANELGFGDHGRTYAIAAAHGPGSTYAVRREYDERGAEHDALVQISDDEEWTVDDVPAGLALMALDRFERPLGIADGVPWWRARPGKWRKLDVPPLID